MHLERVHREKMKEARALDVVLSKLSPEQLENCEDPATLDMMKRWKNLRIEIHAIEEEHQRMNEKGIKNRIKAYVNRQNLPVHNKS